MEYLAFLSPIDRLPPPPPLSARILFPRSFQLLQGSKRARIPARPLPGSFFISFCNILARVKIARNGERNPQGCSGMLGDARGCSGMLGDSFQWLLKSIASQRK